MYSERLLAMLRCPSCVRETGGLLSLQRSGYWIVCQGCGAKYPIRAGIPVMLEEEAVKWADYEIEKLPIPPPGS